MAERIRYSEDRALFQAQYITTLEEPLVLPGIVKTVFRTETKVTFQQLWWRDAYDRGCGGGREFFYRSSSSCARENHGGDGASYGMVGVYVS